MIFYYWFATQWDELCWWLWNLRRTPKLKLDGIRILMSSINGIGWEIQTYTDKTGWSNTFTDIEGQPLVFAERNQAEVYLENLQQVWPTASYRLYEALELPAILYQP